MVFKHRKVRSYILKILNRVPTTGFNGRLGGHQGGIRTYLSGEGHTWAVFLGDSWNNYLFRFRVKIEEDAFLHANFRVGDESERYIVGIGSSMMYLSKQLGPGSFEEGLLETGGIGTAWSEIEISGEGSESPFPKMEML